LTIPVGSDVDPAAGGRLRDLSDLLVRWNERFNLTAIKDPAEIDARLIGDALRMLPALDALVDPIAARQSDPGRADRRGHRRGLPWARPRHRPAGARRHAARRDRQEDPIRRAGHRRARSPASPGPSTAGPRSSAGQEHHRERYDLVTARAVAALPALLELTLPLLRIGGSALLPKGPDIEGELREGAAAAGELGGEIAGDTLLPEVEGSPRTRLIVARKLWSTPTQFPRRSGIPAKDPLGRTSA
jgi:16S rRNA (guanine527-N7)-methyltransferase